MIHSTTGDEMASYDFNRIMMGAVDAPFNWARFFRELGLAAFARKALRLRE